mgnify:FL=1
MSRLCLKGRLFGFGFPRSRGDEPRYWNSGFSEWRFSPLTRG